MSKLVAVVLLFFITLIPRVYNLQATEIYPDEITWAVRSKETFYGIKAGNLFTYSEPWWKTKNDTEAVNLPTTIAGGASMFLLATNQPTNYSLELVPDYIAPRIASAFLSSIFIVIYYLAITKLSSRKIALLASLLFSLDPIHIALSRWFLPDLYLAFWMFLALSSFMVIKNKTIKTFITALFVSLAFLTKPTGLLVLAPIFLMSPIWAISLGIMSLFIIHFLWLGNEDSIGIEVLKYFQNQAQLAEKPFNAFFNGKITYDPPWYYYLYVLVVRLPESVLLAIVAIPFIKNLRRYLNKEQLSLILFTFLYILVMSLSAKKLGIRYLFPISPWLYFFAATAVIRTIKSRLIIIILILYSVINVFLYFPNYYLYFNNISGGPNKVQQNYLVALCQGAKGSIDHILSSYKDVTTLAYIGCNYTAVPYYSAIKVVDDWQAQKVVVIEESYKQLHPNHPAAIFFSNKQPDYVNQFNGVVLSRIYLNH